MNKAGFIQIIQHGRSTMYGKRRFRDKWIDMGEINKKERVSCCYALFYKGARDNEQEMLTHVASNEHVLKLVARLGFNDEYLLNEVRYYASKILEG